MREQRRKAGIVVVAVMVAVVRLEATEAQEEPKKSHSFPFCSCSHISTMAYTYYDAAGGISDDVKTAISIFYCTYIPPSLHPGWED